MTTRLLRLPLILLLLLVSVQSAFAAVEARTYTLQNRPADEVATQLRDLYPEPQLAISAHDQQLILRGEPRILDESGTLVGTMDVAPMQVKITVRRQGSHQGQHKSGGITVKQGQAHVGAQNRVITTERQQEQSLVVQDGQSAQIRAGQVRALPVAFQGGRNPAAILQYVNQHTGFVVSPQVISSRQVELSIMAFDNSPDTSTPGYDTEAVMTIRRVAPGTWVSLGGTDTNSKDSETGIVYQTGNTKQDSQSFEIRVDIL